MPADERANGGGNGRGGLTMADRNLSGCKRPKHDRPEKVEGADHEPTAPGIGPLPL